MSRARWRQGRWPDRPAGARAGPRRAADQGARAAVSAAPTCTWPRATWRRSAPDVTPGPRGGRRGRRAPGRARPGSAPGDRVGVAWLARHRRLLPVLPPRRGEPLPALGLHRLGQRRRLRRATWSRPTPTCYRAARRVQRRRARAAAVRGHHRLPGPARGPSCRPAAGSASTASAARRTSPRRSRSRAGRGRARVHPRRRQPASSPSSSAPRRRRTRSTRRRSRWTRRSSSPRSATWSRPRCAALDRGGTLAVAGIYLTDIPALNYDADLFQERDAAQRHLQHPGRRRGVPAAGRAAAAPGHAPRPTRSTRPTRRWPTWPRTGSPARPC